MNSNQTALVTGAGGGLGRTLCLQLARNGSHVVAFDRDEEGLRELEAELKPLGVDVLTVVGDITNSDDIDALTQQVAARAGGVDLLIHNAGVTHFSTFAQSGPEVTARVMSINFLGAVTLTYAMLDMLKASKGTIVAVSSVAGFAPLYGRTGYAASKHAMHGFFESLRGELQDDGVHVMMVCPSFIATQAQGATQKTEQGVSRPGSATQTAGKPLSAEFVAAKILEGVRRGRRQLVVGRIAKIAWWLSRLFPTLFETKMIEKTRSELDAPESRP